MTRRAIDSGIEREDTGSGVDLPAPELSGLGQQIERARVFGALFQSKPEQHQLGRYLVLGLLGQGGMGQVLEAFDRTLDRRVALKVLHHELDEQHQQRLLREAQALAKISHPNVVQVYEVGESDGRIFIAMELVRGHTLRKWQRRDPVPGWRERLSAYLQAGRGLAACHAAGLVHRDFKPGNVVIDDEGRVRLLDFGLVRAMDDGRYEASPPSDDQQTTTEQVLGTSMTRTGAVLGTPAYMPPEQIHGRDADARSDQFSFCVSLFESLYGERPFAGSTLPAVVLSMRSGTVQPRPKDSEVPVGLYPVLQRGLSTDPDARWASMDALLAELARFESRSRGRRRGLALAVFGGLAALGVGVAQYAAVGFRCEGASARLDGIWDDGRRAALEASIVGTGLSYAPDTWERVERRLDAYAEAFVGKHIEVCEATRVTQEQTEAVMQLRMACLEDRRIAMRETTALLLDATEDRIEKAVDLVAELPELGRCDDIEALQADLPPPDDPATAAEIEQLRTELIHARVLRAAGDPRASLAIVDPIVERAHAVAYEPLVIEAQHARGKLLLQLGRFDESVGVLEDAYLGAARLAHTSVEMSAAQDLAFLVGYKMSNFEAGVTWGKTAVALAGRECSKRTCEANALRILGSILHQHNELEPALEHYRRAEALLDDAAADPGGDRAALYVSIGNTLMRQGDLSAALESMQTALTIERRLLGPRHPRLALTKTNMGNVLTQLGRHDDALGQMRDSLTIREAALGPGHPDVAASHLGIAYSLENLGRYEEAIEHLRRGIAIMEDAGVVPTSSSAQAHNNLGYMYQLSGDAELSRRHYEESLVHTEATLGPDHPKIAYALAGLMGLALDRGDLATVREHAQRGLEILEPTGFAPDLIAIHRWGLALGLWPLPEQRARALELAQQAHDHYVARGGSVTTLLRELEPIDAWLAERRGSKDVPEGPGSLSRPDCRSRRGASERCPAKGRADRPR